MWAQYVGRQKLLGTSSRDHSLNIALLLVGRRSDTTMHDERLAVQMVLIN
jgi:hypothetical protein